MRRILISLVGLLAVMLASPALAAAPEIAQAETAVDLNAGVTNTRYHENLVPGDDENGVTPGFGVGAAALLPLLRGWNPDLYTALNYDFDAGNLHYSGHYVLSGAPTTATDNAVFNRVEAKLGLGYQFPGIGVELIPFFAAGYQSWNRNINSKGVTGTDEFYHSALLGGGMRLDLPITPGWVGSVDGEVLGLVGGGIALNNFGSDQDFGASGAQRVSLGLDDALSGRFHLTGTLSWQHFNYSGSKPQVVEFVYLIHEPLSVTTQMGINLGLAYSFY
jgi:hypothetical protein